MSKNLIPGAHKLTLEEQSAGGRASVEVRRKKKQMREWAEVFGSMPFKVRNADGSESDTDYDGAIVAGLYQKAIQEQDVRAAEFLAKLTGQLKEQVELGGTIQGVQVVVQDSATAEALQKILNDNE